MVERPTYCMLCLLLGFALEVCVAHAQSPGSKVGGEPMIQAEHPWGRFPVGSWKCVRVRTEALDPSGQVTDASTTETRTTLEKVAGDCFTLRVEVMVEVSGKKFKAEPKFLVQGYYGQSCDHPVTVIKQGTGELNINGQQIATEIRSVSFKEGDGRHVSTIQFAPNVMPHILRRESRLLSAAGEPTGTASTVEVIALDLPFNLLQDMKTCWQTKTVQTHEKRTTVTLEVHCRDVPGGLVSHSSKTSDESGRHLERSTLEVVDFGIGTDEGQRELQTSRRRLFSRHRTRDGVR